MAQLRRTVRTVRMRIVALRWPLLSAAVLVVVVHAGGGTAALVLALVALLVLAAFPRGRAAASRPQGPPPLSTRGGLTAEMMAEAVADPLIVMDAAGAAVHANSAARDAFGKLPKGMELVLKFRTPEIQALLDSVRAGERSSGSVEYVERVPYERVFQVSASEVGRQTGLFVVVFRDQSETRRIDRMRADFIANASHELRTPLASIAGFVETLRGPARDDPAARERFLGIMHNQTERMARLIDDLLSLSRLEMKQQPAAGRSVDLAAVMRAVTEALAPLAAESGVRVETVVGAGPFDVAGDRDELFQVLENLLENACKYGQSGGRVLISLDRAGTGDDAEVVLSVRDFGPGIPAEHIPRITERFYRIDVDSSRARKGTGLGLAIVKHIATRHRARLSIRSEPGAGAAFTLNFPASQGSGHLPAN